jgi:hypothetical protein
MPLLELQSALLLALHASPKSAETAPALPLSADERRYLDRLTPTRGFAFTAEVRRSWCELRATRAAGLTLAALGGERRRELIAEWLDRGGGASSFFASEAEDFLEFVAARLPEPSHALSLCRFEHAVHRAASAAAVFVHPARCDRDAPVRQGAGAALVAFYADPAGVLWSTGKGAPVLPMGDRSELLFAPGLPDLCRPASASDRRLWNACAETSTVRELTAAGHAEEHVDDLLTVGALELQ